MLCDHKPRVHSFVYITVGPDNFWLVDLDLQFLLKFGLGLIKDRVLGAVGAKIMEDSITVDEVKGFPGWDDNDVGVELASSLVNLKNRRGLEFLTPFDV